MFFNRKNADGNFGRGKTREYRDWITEAGWHLVVQKPKPFDGRVIVDVRLPEKPGMQPDADNTLKAINDLLVRHKVIKGDSKKYLRGGSYAWDDTTDMALVTIRAA